MATPDYTYNGQRFKLTTITDTGGITTAYYVVNCSKATDFTVTLPSISSSNYHLFFIKNINTGVVTIDGNSTDLIDSTETLILRQHESIIIYNNGTTWNILARNRGYSLLNEAVYTDDDTIEEYDVKVTINKGSAISIDLPLVANTIGKYFPIKNIGAGACTLSGNGAETIDGSADLTLNENDACILYNDGTEWQIISFYDAVP